MQTQMKHILILATLMLASCAGSIDILGKNVAIVNDRNPDGTFKAVSQVTHPTTGESPIGAARLYAYPGGDVAVSLYGSGPLSGTAAKLRQ